MSVSLEMSFCFSQVEMTLRREIHPLSRRGFRTRNPRMQVAADSRLRQRGHVARSTVFPFTKVSQIFLQVIIDLFCHTFVLLFLLISFFRQQWSMFIYEYSVTLIVSL
jgi:hypothetical protein